MSSDDAGYVHRPGERDTAANASSSDPEPVADGFGTRGWVLVAVLAACFLVIPGVIYVRPGILSALGVPYLVSLLVLPLLPAAALGLTAVWAMTAATHGDE